MLNDDQLSETAEIIKAFTEAPNNRVSSKELVSLSEHMELMKSSEKDHAPRRNGEPTALQNDPSLTSNWSGYRTRPTGITNEMLGQMVWKIPHVGIIIKTRLTQVARYLKFSPDIYAPGFRVQKKGLARNKSMTKTELGEADTIRDALLNCGYYPNEYYKGGLKNWWLMVGRDSLTYDQACWEVVRDRKGRPSYWLPVDASSIYLVDNAFYAKDYAEKDRQHTVQLRDQVVVNVFTEEQLAFETRNPYSSIALYRNGISELEMMMTTLTWLVWSMQYNGNIFRQGSMIDGFLNLKSETMNNKAINSFKREWYNLITGVSNAHRMPILTGNHDIEYITTKQNNREMEYGAWHDLLTKLVCGMYQIDPMEINLKYGSSGQDKSMFETNEKNRLIASRDKGVLPLIENAFDWMNKWFVAPYNDDFEVVPTGLEQDRTEEADLNEKRVRISHTLNEIRAEQGLPKLEGGDIVLNPVYIQNLQGLRAQEQQQQAGKNQEDDPKDKDQNAEKENTITDEESFNQFMNPSQK